MLRRIALAAEPCKIFGSKRLSRAVFHERQFVDLSPPGSKRGLLRRNQPDDLREYQADVERDVGQRESVQRKVGSIREHPIKVSQPVPGHIASSRSPFAAAVPFRHPPWCKRLT